MVCAFAGGAAASPRPPKSILEIPCPIVDPTATLPAVAAIWAIMPGCFVCPCCVLACAGGAGAAVRAGAGAAMVDDEREPEGFEERPPPPLDR